MAPLVSVIIPMFRAERFIGETIASVRAQTVEDWEMFLCDDGSPDATVATAREHAAGDARITILEHPPTRHPGATRNRGIARATGRYLAFLDSDDLWKPNKLEVHLAAMQAEKKPGLGFTLVEEFWDKPGPAPATWPRRPPPPTREEQYRENLIVRSWPATSTFLIEKCFADEIGPFTEVPMLSGDEDWDYALKALWRRPFVFVGQQLTRYRLHDSNITAVRFGEWRRRFAEYEQIEARGEMPTALRSKAYSAANTIKGEYVLRAGESGWRAAFLKAWRLDPLNWRRWPGLAAMVLPRGAMRSYYRALKRLQGARFD